MEVVLHLPVVPNVELVAAKAVEALGVALGMSQTRVEAACVAIVEACLNAMEHGGGEVVVRLSGENESGRPRLVIWVGMRTGRCGGVQRMRTLHHTSRRNGAGL